MRHGFRSYARASVLIEAIFGLVLLTLVLGVVGRGMAQGERMATDSRLEIEARQAVLSELERLRAAPFEVLVAEKGRKERDLAAPAGAKLAISVSPDADDSILKVTVTVRWPSADGHPRERTLETLRARAGGTP